MENGTCELRTRPARSRPEVPGGGAGGGENPGREERELIQAGMQCQFWVRRLARLPLAVAPPYRCCATAWIAWIAGERSNSEGMRRGETAVERVV